ncbi:MAG: cupin domain-containing protein [Thaumarchaeota archaeon]|nr:cupin domain-containing protein [Nitrososphaerota archaeon]
MVEKPMTIKVVTVKPSFTDNRGMITNILEEPINSVVLITCKKGAIRANHFHQKDSHWSYMVSGKMEYYERNSNGQLEMTIIEAGQMVYSAPGVPHAMKFLEPSVFLALTTRKRSKGRYDEDTIKCEII